MTDTYDQAQLKELLLQMVETELGGEQVYLQALESVVNDDLRKEWQGYGRDPTAPRHPAASM